MLIRYTGSGGRRIVGPYEWNRENGYVVEVVQAEEAADLLTHGGFEIAEGDSLLEIAGDRDRAGELVLAGVSSPEWLRGLGAKEIKALAKETGISEEDIREWVKAAGEEEQHDS